MARLATMTIVPVFGWIVSAILAILMTVPMWFLWSWLGPTFFTFVPAVWINISFPEMAGMLILIGFIKLVFLPSALNRTVN